MERPDGAEYFARYLDAKRTVDDRSLNRWVLDALQNALADEESAVDVLELGGGAGSTALRAAELGLPNIASWTMLDRSAELNGRAREKLGGKTPFPVRTFTAELSAALEDPALVGSAGLLVAHAFLDLLPLSRDLPRILRLIQPGGLFWFTLNFDGRTRFLPDLDSDRDARLMERYHASMRTVEPDGSLRAGNDAGGDILSRLCADPSLRLLEAGSSDWVVFPSQGAYRAQEKTLLLWMTDNVFETLSSDPGTDQEFLRIWRRDRLERIDAGALSLVAHQLDFCGRMLR